jgi:hypothetical protein
MFLLVMGDADPSYDAVELVVETSFVAGINAVTGAQATCPAVPPFPVEVGPQVDGAAGPVDISAWPFSSSTQGELGSQPESGPGAPSSPVAAPDAAPAIVTSPPAADHDSEEMVAAFVSLLAAETPVMVDPIGLATVGMVVEDTCGAGSDAGLVQVPNTSAFARLVGEAVTARPTATPLKVYSRR